MKFQDALVRVGTVISRTAFAIGVILFLTAATTFLTTGSWLPYTLGGALAFYKVTVPNFGLSGLLPLYGFAGSVWLFIYFLCAGLILALVSAKAAPQSTMSYLQAILILPITAVSLTISGFFSVVRGLLKYTIFAITSVIIVVCLWWGADFALHANRFSANASCNLRQTVFGDVTFNFLFKCADASVSKMADGNQYFIMFMASETNPDPVHTGHAWLATARIRKTIEKRPLILDYEVTGYGPPGGAATDQCYPVITWLYLAIRPAIPFASPVEQYWCLRGAIRNEGRPSIHNPAGQPFPEFHNADAVDALLGVNPAVVFAVNVDRDQYDNVARIIANQTSHPKNYQLGLNDCTTFVREVAAEIGLYLPPRILSPYPSSSIYTLMRFNMSP